MPHAPKTCRECRNRQPCPDHPLAKKWGNVHTQPLPRDWQRLVRVIKEHSQLRCAHCGRYSPDGEVDHKVNRAAGGTDELKNLQWLCRGCHHLKTIVEARIGREKHRRR